MKGEKVKVKIKKTQRANNDKSSTKNREKTLLVYTYGSKGDIYIVKIEKTRTKKKLVEKSNIKEETEIRQQNGIYPFFVNNTKPFPQSSFTPCLYSNS